MHECDKWCLANVGGKCAVKECGGEIRRTGRPETDVIKAAKIYDMSRSIFKKEFFEFPRKERDGESDE